MLGEIQKRILLESLVAMAKIQGLSVPIYRFDIFNLNPDLIKLSMSQAASELWLNRFPLGAVVLTPPSDLSENSFPILWVDDLTAKIVVLKSKFSNGDFATEHGVFKSEESYGGKFLKLLNSDDEQGAIESGTTAHDRFRHAIKKKKGIFIEAIGATLLINLLGIFTAMYTMQVYDRVIPTQGFATLWALTIGVLLAILFEFLVRQVRSIMTERATKAIDLELTGVFFSKALSIRMDKRPPTVGTFASQIRHFESVRSFMTSTVLFVLADLPFALFFIVIVGLIGGALAIVPLITVPLAVFVSLFFRKSIETLTQAHLKESNEKNGLLIESIDGIESIKATGSEWKIYDRYMSLSRSMSFSESQLKVISARASHLSMVIQQINYVALIAVGSYLISEGTLSMGGLIASSIIMGRIFNPLAQVPNMVVQWKHAQISLKSLDGIMAMPDDRPSDSRLFVPDELSSRVSLEGVSFSYLEGLESINVDKLDLSPGEKVAIIGPVGSGKSTLLKVLSGLYAPSSGIISFGGVDVRQLSPDYMREHVGYLPQEVRLFNGTLRHNLTIGLAAPSDTEIMRACESTGLADFIRSRPEGLEITITEGGRGLSGGQKQLVGLTRLLLMRPSVLLLDEPTASMDGELESKVMRLLLNSRSEKQLSIIVTHKKAVLSQVDRIIVIAKGRIALDGSKNDVLRAITEKVNAARSLAL